MSDAKPVLYLHIGAAKSGSSAIQAALRENDWALRREGIRVAANDLKVGGRISGGQVEFFEELLPVTESGIALVGQRLNSLAGSLIGRATRAAVVSAENLSNSAEYARLFQTSQELFDIQVVIYIRRQDEYLVGSWNQWYFNENESFSDWVASMVARGFANWDNLIKRWATHLPTATMNVRVYDRGRFAGGSILNDFATVLGVSSETLPLMEGDVNRSLNELAMNVAYRNRALFRDAQDRQFLEFLAEFGGDAATTPMPTGLYFTSDERRRVLDSYAPSNERVRSRYFPDLPEGGLFPLPDESDDSISRDEAVAMELDLLWTALFRMYKRSKPRR